MEADLVSWEAMRVAKLEICNTQDALKATRKAMWPILHELLVIGFATAITTVECEHHVSELQCLKTYLRSNMGNVCLTSLALINSHYDMNIDSDVVLSMFQWQHPRRTVCHDVLEDEV